MDLSTNSGWAVGRDGGERPAFGTWHLGRMSSGLGRIFSCLAASLAVAILTHSPDAVIFEAPLPQQKRDTQQIARLLVGLAAVAEMICFEHQIPCTEALPHEVRKLVFGTANIRKEGVISWCQSRGWDTADDNQADALALLHYRHILGRMRIMAGAGSV